MKLTIDEYSRKYKMSKEMINSKIKTKRLNHIVENGTIYIVIQEEQNTTAKPAQQVVRTRQAAAPTTITKPRTTVATVLALYQRENAQLKAKILQLEEKIDKLIDDKEQMLREERDRIEHVYNTKDEQLKSILKVINTKLLSEKEPDTIHEIETYESEEEIYSTNDIFEKESVKKESKLVELREYLKTLDLKSYQRKAIKKKFLSVYDSDVRIIQQNGNLYLDFSKYDYSDLLAH